MASDPCTSTAELDDVTATTFPVGTVTFLFTDIEGSTQLLQRTGERYPELLDEHRRLLEDAFARHGGNVVGTEGDSFFVCFTRASEAIAAAIDGQLALSAHAWPPDTEIRVRMGIHTGEAALRDGDYVGLAVHEAARVSSAAHGGQILITSATAQVAGVMPADVAAQNLGPHRLKDLEEPIPLLQLIHPRLRREFPPPRSLDARPNNLPVDLSRFIGREHEIAQMLDAITQSRLVTVTGAGGIGKTRLAVEVARELLDRFADGTWFVDLASLTDTQLVGDAIATAMGIRLDGDRSSDAVEIIVDHVRTKRVLVVLDNCEHLVEPCALAAETLLQRCPELHVLATSREPLGLAGEMTWRVPSLAQPTDTDPPDVITAADSVQLFVDRARAARHDFELGASDVPAIARICARLDGIPLAIELAAARARSLTCSAIAERLDDRFRLLVGGSRTALPRQRTLEALVDWSYDLLDEDERSVLRRLSIFSGSFSLEGAEAVCPGPGLQPADVLDRIEALLDKSLVQLEGRSGRYRLLETVREYARHKMLDAGEADQVRERHLTFYVDLVGRKWRDVLWGPAVRETIALFEEEHDNIRGACEYATEAHPALAVRLTGVLGWFWWIRGYLAEGRRRLKDALDAHGRLASHDLAAALATHAFLAQLEPDLVAVEASAREAVTMIDRLGPTDETAWAKPWALASLGAALNARDDADAAVRACRDGLEDAHAHGERLAEGRCLQELAHSALMREDYTGALELAEEALVIVRELPSDIGVVRILASIAAIAGRVGDRQRALAAMDEGLETARRIDDRIGVTGTLMARVLDALNHGEFTEALEYATEAVDFARRWGDTSFILSVLNYAGYAAIGLHDFARAADALDEAIAIGRASAPAALPNVLHSKAELAIAVDDLDQADALLAEAVAAFEARETPSKSGMFSVEISRGHVAARRGNFGEALDHYRRAAGVEGRGQAREMVLDGLARIAAARGRLADAARMFGGLWAGAGVEFPTEPGPVDPGRDDAVRAIQEGLPASELDAAFEAGRELTVAEAFELLGEDPP